MTESQLATQIAAAVAKAMGASNLNKPNKKVRKAKGKGRTKLTDAERAVFMAKNDVECVEAFNKAGYADVQPRVNALTYNKWIALGRMVRKGEKSIRVGPFALFHESQTSPITAEAPAVNAVAA